MTRITRPPLHGHHRPQLARLDPKSLPAARPATPEGTKTVSERKQDHFFPGGAPGSGSARDSTWLEGGKRPGKKPLLEGSRPVKGDSFAADRINRGHEGGELVGSKNDQVSTTFRVDAENDPATVVKVPSEGKSVRQLEHENAVLRQELEALEKRLEKLKNKTPNPESDGGSSGPVTQQEVNVQRKGSPKPRGDGDDGRGDTQQASGGGPVRATRGQDDRPERVKTTGTLDMDAVLQLDQLVNPQRH